MMHLGDVFGAERVTVGHMSKPSSSLADSWRSGLGREWKCGGVGLTGAGGLEYSRKV